MNSGDQQLTQQHIFGFETIKEKVGHENFSYYTPSVQTKQPLYTVQQQNYQETGRFIVPIIKVSQATVLCL